MKKGFTILLLSTFAFFSLMCFDDGSKNTASKTIQNEQSVQTGAAAPINLHQGLIAHYKLDGNATDSVGTYHGAVHGKGGFSEEPLRGEVLHQRSIYTTVRVDPVVDLAEEWTITGWFKGLVDSGWKTFTKGSTKDYQIKI
ncbi:MAG: hypothetical protein GY754_38985, partial [bacterium]|nr:hypothetical protein [bacterium]